MPGFVGQLSGVDGKAIVIDGLWGLIAGNDGNGGSSQKIYFSAGPNAEADGLFGVIQAVPEPRAIVLELAAAAFLAGSWTWKNRKRRSGTGRILCPAPVLELRDSGSPSN